MQFWGRPPKDPLSDDFMTAYIPLTRGMVAKVDWKYREKVRAKTWRAVTSRGHTYAVAIQRDETGRWQPLRMHRWLVNAPEGMMVDHINRDGLDNRLCNLRIVEQQANQVNVARRPERNKCGYHGIHFDKRQRRYYGKIMVHYVPLLTSGFNTPEEAARAWDALAFKIYGKDVIDFNFPSDVGEGAFDDGCNPARLQIVLDILAAKKAPGEIPCFP